MTPYPIFFFVTAIFTLTACGQIQPCPINEHLIVQPMCTSSIPTPITPGGK